jgi:hypothetical protein
LKKAAFIPLHAEVVLL